MIRKFKTLGVAMVAVLALSAVVASAASATNFTASSYPTAASATSAAGNGTFNTNITNLSVECHAAFAVASLSEPSETVTVTPTYTGCKAFGFLSATVNMNGCDYTFFTNGTVNFNCSGTNRAAIVAGTCEVQIGAQNSLIKVDLANNGTGISAQATVTGIGFTVTKDGLGCPFHGTGNKANASYSHNQPIQISSTNGATIDIG